MFAVKADDYVLRYCDSIEEAEECVRQWNTGLRPPIFFVESTDNTTAQC